MPTNRLRAARGKKILCDPPAAAAIETADRMCFTDGMATPEEILEYAACEESFTADMEAISKRIVERLRSEAD